MRNMCERVLRVLRACVGLADKFAGVSGSGGIVYGVMHDAPSICLVIVYSKLLVIGHRPC